MEDIAPLPPPSGAQSRADELQSLLYPAIEQLVAFLRAADTEHTAHISRSEVSKRSLIEPYSPQTLTDLLKQTILNLDQQRPPQPPPSSTQAQSQPQHVQQNSQQQQHLLTTILPAILQYSVNTSAPGFLDKLYTAPSPPGILADLVLSVLNTNVHVYHVSPVLTLVEKHVTRMLAGMFGLDRDIEGITVSDVAVSDLNCVHPRKRSLGLRAGGISTQGGSASLLTSVVTARNWFRPDAKFLGTREDLVLFASAHAHYSVEKAASVVGLGSRAVVSVPVDQDGCMGPEQLEAEIRRAITLGRKPFYVCATAGTTVLGSFDPLRAVGEIARRYGCWYHVDACWGGSFVFAGRADLRGRLDGVDLADSVSFNPHKMMGVPLTCSFLLVRDLRELWRANSSGAGYLFHDEDDDDEDGDDKHGAIGGKTQSERDVDTDDDHGDNEDDDTPWREPYDLADLTMQCGRRGDSLKIFFAWQYYGTAEFAAQIDGAYIAAQYLGARLQDSKDFLMVSRLPTPCLQVCFHYAPGRQLVFGSSASQLRPRALENVLDEDRLARMYGRHNSKVTESITKALVPRGWMIDHAPALEGREAEGKFFRVVVHMETAVQTIDRLLSDLQEGGVSVVNDLRQRHSLPN